MPRFKSFALRGAPPRLTVRFADGDPLFELADRLSSEEFRGAIGGGSLEEIRGLAEAEGRTVHAFVHERLTAFAGKRTTGYDGWPPGSPVRTTAIREFVESAGASAVLDPFGGRASYPVAAGQSPHPRRVFWCEISRPLRDAAEARIRTLMLRDDARSGIASELERLARRLARATASADPADMLAAPAGLDDAAAGLLARLRTVLTAVRGETAGLASAAVVEVLLRGAPAGGPELLEAVRAELRRAAGFAAHEAPLVSTPVRVADDARDLGRIRPLAIDCVVTNPPSLNFATYSNPAANWFAGVQRPPAARLLPVSAALAELRSLLGARGADAVAAIASDLRALAPRHERFARIAANYFRDMAAALCAVETHLTRHASFGLVVRASSVAGVSIDTPAHLVRMLETFGFAVVSSGAILSLRR